MKSPCNEYIDEDLYNELKVGISSSHEEEILTVAERLITPPTNNKESTFEESCTFDGEKSWEQDIREDNEELQHDMRSENYAYKIPIK